MKRLFYSLLIFVSALPLQAQIQNGSFENWSSGEPVGWFTNNIPQLSAYPVTQSSFSHSGSSSLKGEVVEVDAGGQQFPYAPNLASGDENNNYFPFHSTPDVIKGLYNFQPVGGDGLQASIVIGTGSTALGSGQVTTYTPTGAGWHDLVFNMYYADTVNTPTVIYIFVTIIPPPGGTNPHIGSVFYLDDFPKVTLIKPAEEAEAQSQLVFISGETDTIKWNSGGTEYVDIAYSVDEGASYTNIVQNYSGSEDKYLWNVPDNITPTRKAKIKVTDADNGVEVHSINFTIKPWQLSRIVNDELELYEPNQDGWVFENGGTNMWPISWWSQFSYVGIDPYTQIRYPFGYPFNIANPWDFPDWPLFVEVFDTTQCYVSAQFGLYNTTAEDVWPAIDGRNYNGSCFGFSVTSLLAFYYKSELQSAFPGVGSFNRLYELALNDARRKIINNFYIQAVRAG